MNPTLPAKVIFENLADGAQAIEPLGGRRPAVEIDAAGVRAALEAFSQLQAFEAEDANSRIHLAAPRRRLIVRYGGGRLIVDEGSSFTYVTVDEVVTRLFAPPAAGDPAPEEAGFDDLPAEEPRRRWEIWALAALLVLTPLVWSWTAQSSTPPGVEWETDSGQRRSILESARGSYVGDDDERLAIDPVRGRLIVAAEKSGVQKLNTSLRVGHRDGTPVVMTEGGVLIEIEADGTLHLGDSVYRRMGLAR